ncbi:hypothetical protein BJ138DRAFT_1208636 [Hygrophoropsis aurantiaca]|uniref:Uncharacterized protein n=1 Tax=Hygrophoropsis aurantiaca TaxID=72124 RepID=A0ACB8A4W5_9AGAM|nr:hypothetical protein BJ138DRAFT_1208636 [Hygrophoropsis aurantiaca]
MADFGFTIQELQAMQTSNCVTAAAGALVVYDHAFSHEVDHIWARYSGDLQMIAIAAGFMCIDWTNSLWVYCRALYIYMKIYMAVNWGQTIFILTMQAILVIRVYALFNRSKKVLIFLVTFYGLQTIATFVMLGFMFNKRALHEYVTSISPTIGSVTQDINLNLPSKFFPFVQAMTILPVAFDTFLLFFALWAFLKHALEAKKLNGGWSINVLVRTLMADHLVYFVCNLTWLSLMVAANYFTTELKVSGISFYTATYFFTALVVVVGPRMVISLRAVEKTRREGVILGTIQGTIRSGIREPLTQSETVMEIGGRFRATDEHCE